MITIMRRAALASLATALIGGSALAIVHAEAPSIAAAPEATAVVRDMLDGYCLGCHNERLESGGLVLDALDLEQLNVGAATWEKVIKKVRAGLMPPLTASKPPADERQAFIQALETSLDAAATASPNAGMTVPHRLNRTEYANAIRDILGLEIDVAGLLPPDESGYGFDNIGNVLSMTPGLLDRYLLAAHKVSRLAVGDPTIPATVETFRVPYLTLRQDVRMSTDLPAGSRGGAVFRHTFPVDGEYEIALKLQRNSLNIGNDVRGVNVKSQIDVRLDGARVHLFEVGGPDQQQVSNYVDGNAPEADDNLIVRLALRAGTHEIGVAFDRQQWVIEGVGPSTIPVQSNDNFDATESNEGTGRVDAGLDSVEIAGPFHGRVPRDSPSRREIFICQPTNADTEARCAEEILSHIARRAYRRPITAEEMEELLAIFDTGRSRGTFDTGVQYALERILADPDFLFRVEQGVREGDSGPVTVPISDLELASRLSFFLWSSVPDDELLDLAVEGRLREPGVLEEQVARMLQDDRSGAFVDNFFGQWFRLRNLQAHKPDAKAFPLYDDNLRRAFQRETELFLRSQVREDRPAMELLTADYTYVNERLARHYGIATVYGSHFRRVTYPDALRAGILGHGSVLTVTSYVHRTSPVLRGAWILSDILGVPPPPPPANVPPFPENDGEAAPRSVRERMEQHRKNPVCAACHRQMDPLGFALENFDAVGAWRTEEANVAIDASGSFPGGAVQFDSPDAFRQGLLQYRELILGTVIEKLATYALGRGVEYYDMPAVRKIMKDTAADQHRWSSLIVGVVKSVPFQMQTLADAKTD